MLFNLVCIGCSEITVNEPRINENVIIPLQLGNVWNYHISVFTNDSIMFVEYDRHNKIIKDTVADNERWFLTSTENSSVDSFWCINRDDGYWVKPVLDDTLSFNVIPFMKYKYPCKVGDIFEASIDWEVINVDTAVEVQSGTFKCILFRTRTYYNPQSSYEEDFVAVNIGLVMLRTYNRLSNGDPYLFSIHELSSLDLIKE